ncbi:unnamed protein product [Trichogramma brassicae]|uniref:DUF7041 domain-containing protein n=1 Tax=Trichogramma brassicae TaxID=86971 RepID=A0A6H5IN64_9HYME|nr:unnamed protein product [Trichogramma brassicae]
MEDLRAAINLISPGNFLASIYLKDAFHLIPLHRGNRKLVASAPAVARAIGKPRFRVYRRARLTMPCTLAHAGQWAEIEHELNKLWRRDDQLEQMIAGAFERFHGFEREWGEVAAQYSKPHRRTIKDWEDERQAIRDYREEREKKRNIQDEKAAQKERELQEKRGEIEKLQREREQYEDEMRRLLAEAREIEEVLERAQAVEVLGSTRECFRCSYPGRVPWTLQVDVVRVHVCPFRPVRGHLAKRYFRLGRSCESNRPGCHDTATYRADVVPAGKRLPGPDEPTLYLRSCERVRPAFGEQQRHFSRELESTIVNTRELVHTCFSATRANSWYRARIPRIAYTSPRSQRYPSVPAKSRRGTIGRFANASLRPCSVVVSFATLVSRYARTTLSSAYAIPATHIMAVGDNAAPQQDEAASIENRQQSSAAQQQDGAAAFETHFKLQRSPVVTRNRTRRQLADTPESQKTAETQVHDANEPRATDLNSDQLLVSSTLSNSTPNMHDQAKADSSSDLSLSLPSQLDGANLELHQMREQLRNMQAELQQARSASAAQQQILIPPPNMNKSNGAIKKTPDPNLAVIQQSIIDAGFSALGVSNGMTSRNATAASSYSAASAPPHREHVQPQAFTSSKQMLNFPPVSQISSAILYPTQCTFAPRQASAQCTSALPQTSVQYTTAPMQQCTQPSMQPALMASQSTVQSQSQYTPPLIQPIPYASFAQQTQSTAPPPPVQINAGTQAAAQRKLDKFPDFYKHSPQLWISLLESQFTAAGITAPQDKYYHLVTKLGHDVTAELKLSLITLPRNNEYNALKAILLRKYVENDTTKIKRLSENLNGMQDLTPSEYLNHLASASDQWIPRESILLLWKKNLPPTISSGLSSVITLDNDSYNRNSQQQPAFNFCIAPVQTPAATADSTSDFDKIAHALSKLEEKMNSFEKKLNKPRYNNTSNNNRNDKKETKQSHKKSSQDIADKEGLCFYHARFEVANRESREATKKTKAVRYCFGDRSKWTFQVRGEYYGDCHSPTRTLATCTQAPCHCKRRLSPRTLRRAVHSCSNRRAIEQIGRQYSHCCLFLNNLDRYFHYLQIFYRKLTDYPSKVLT